MRFQRAITVCEVGLRDGMQIEKTILTVEQKLEILQMLADAGISVIEVGSFMHPKAVPQMANTDEVFQRLEQKPGVEYRALAGNLKGVQRAIACGCKKVKLNVSASRAHNLANLNKLPLETISEFRECTDAARNVGLEVSGSIACPFGSPWDNEIPLQDVKDIIQAYIETGVTEISISDAPGMANPRQVYTMCGYLLDAFPQAKFILHFHNTRGLGIANILAGMDAGITWFDGSLAGTGGCPFIPGAAGNVSTEDIVHMCDEMKISTGVNLDSLILTGRRIEEIIGHKGGSYVLESGKTKDIPLPMPSGQPKNQTEPGGSQEGKR